MNAIAWLPAAEWEGLYEVSDHGGVQSIDRTITQVNCWGNPVDRRLKGRILKQVRINRYWAVHLSNGKYHKMIKVHILMLTTFVGPRPDGLKGLHWDDDPDNNIISNLRWGTLSDNHFDACRNGRIDLSRDAQGRFTWRPT